MGSFDVILPAGGTIPPDFASKVSTENKALIPIGGITILERTLQALQASGIMNRSVVIGPPEVHASPGGQQATFRLNDTGSGPGNILAGLQHLLSLPDAPRQVLVVTTDLPFLSPDLLQRFLAMCPKDRDICVPLINQKEWLSRFPNSSATFVPLTDGKWTTGCVYLMGAEALKKAMPQIERAFAVRKSVIGLAKLLGPAFLVRFLLKRLTVPDIEAKIVDMCGMSGKAVFGAPPELAYDIDDLEDYEYALTVADDEATR